MSKQEKDEIDPLQETKKGNGNGKRTGVKVKKKSFITRWSIIISIWTFFTAVGISTISELLLRNSSLLIAFFTILLIVLVGTLADIVAVAVTAADVKPFAAMAANRVYGAKQAISIVQNAEKYNNFFADVVGDVAGYISGTAGAAVVFQIIALSEELTTYQSVVSIFIAGLISSAIVGTKAVGKNIALTYSTEIILTVSRVITFFKQLLPSAKNGNGNSSNNKRAK